MSLSLTDFESCAFMSMPRANLHSGKGEQSESENPPDVRQVFTWQRHGIRRALMPGRLKDSDWSSGGLTDAPSRQSISYGDHGGLSAIFVSFLWTATSVLGGLGRLRSPSPPLSRDDRVVRA